MSLKRTLAIAALCFTIALGAIVGARTTWAQADAKPALQAGKTIAENLTALAGKSVTLHLRNGSQISGVVKEANAQRVLLTNLTGKEFFDALVNADAIDGVEVRAR